MYTTVITLIEQIFLQIIVLMYSHGEKFAFLPIWVSFNSWGSISGEEFMNTRYFQISCGTLEKLVVLHSQNIDNVNKHSTIS